MVTPNPFKTVVIAGVGLIGGSVALGLKGRFLADKVIGYDANPETLKLALALGVIDEGYVTAGEWAQQADLIILATPVGSLARIARDLAAHAREDVVFTDVGSVKGKVTDLLSDLRNFVPGHPMAGSEKAGVTAARASLLENAIWVLTPTANTPLPLLNKVKQLVTKLGANPVVMPPDAHDQLIATISHLPYMTALALSHMVARDERLALLAAGGFRDITRVASGDPRMSRDMVINNKEALREAISRFKKELEQLEAQLDSPEVLFESAMEGKRTRDSLPIVKRSLIPGLFDLVVAIPDKPGEIGRIANILGDKGINIKDIEVLAIREEGGALRLGFETGDLLEKAHHALNACGYETRPRGLGQSSM